GVIHDQWTGRTSNQYCGLTRDLVATSRRKLSGPKTTGLLRTGHRLSAVMSGERNRRRSARARRVLLAQGLQAPLAQAPLSGFEQIPAARRRQAFEANNGGWTRIL